MVRISAIFIAACMVLIAISLGIVVYLRFGFTGAESALVALGILTALAVYNAVSARLRDRAEASAQISTLSRSSGDLARQLAEFGLRLNAMDTKVEHVLDRSLAGSAAARRRDRGTLHAGATARRFGRRPSIGHRPHWSEIRSGGCRTPSRFRRTCCRCGNRAASSSPRGAGNHRRCYAICGRRFGTGRNARLDVCLSASRCRRRTTRGGPAASGRRVNARVPRSNRRCRPLSGSIAPAS